MSKNKNVDNPLDRVCLDPSEANIAVSHSEVSSVTGSVQATKHRVSTSSERQIKYERAQKTLENAALVSKRIKEHRKATAELLGRPFEDDDTGDTASEMASTVSERTGYSVATDTSTTLSVQDALNIPGISESLANTLKQKELLMERIKQYKEISKRPSQKSPLVAKDRTKEFKTDLKKSTDSIEITLLHNKVKERENALSIIQVKMKAMETTILDLQEKINEKDQIIEAKNKATTLISDSLSKKEKDSLLLLEEAKHQMTIMQENFVKLENEWKHEKQNLIIEIQSKDDKIVQLEEKNAIIEKQLEEKNAIIENSRFELSVEYKKLKEEVDIKNQQILDLSEKLEKLAEESIQKPVKQVEYVEVEKGTKEITDMNELTKKIELLEQLNCQIRLTNKELEDKLINLNVEPKSSSGSPSKKASPLPTRKGSRNKSKQRSPWSNLSSESLPQETDKKPNKPEIAKMEMLVQSLNKDILEKEYAISEKDALISDLQLNNERKDATINEMKQKIQIPQPAVNVVETGVGTDHEKESPLEDTSEDQLSVHDLMKKVNFAEEQIAILNNEIDIANKNMIKVKSSHKLKLKQMQKTIDNFSKVSDSNSEIVRLNEELHQLSQKVAELEEEKGNLQLHLVDYDSGRMTDSDVYKKMVEMENLAESRLTAISILETQKFDLVQELHVVQQKNIEMEDKLADLSQLQSEQVCNEMKSVQLEEQIDELVASKKELELIVENLKLDIENLNDTVNALIREKEDVNKKLEHYIQENIDLTDKLDKLSAEKVSSAESIEIVESLTTQEKLEIEKYNKGTPVDNLESHTEEFKGPILKDCNESIEKLVEESAELNKKIELFTLERQEVMEKMNEILTENKALQQKIKDNEIQAMNLNTKIESLKQEKQEILLLNTDLQNQIEELKRERIEIIKESVDLSKPSSLEDAIEAISTEVQEEKVLGDKGSKGAKSVKQLTKEILKLKNTIKEREAEIGDCQMKILSLQEQEQKQYEIIQNNLTHDKNMEAVVEENKRLTEEINHLKNKHTDYQSEQVKESHDALQHIQRDYYATLANRDAKISELEGLLLEYERQVLHYSSALQQKDKEMSEYINQITKLNDFSQKLKSTIDVLEEEKAKDHNAVLVKSLNNQIVNYQNKLSELEEKLSMIEEEKEKLIAIKHSIENQNISIEKELNILKDSIAEKQAQIKELQLQKNQQSEEMTEFMQLSKERDEEIHEIKLQLRKESIENEKLRCSVLLKDNNEEDFIQKLREAQEQLTQVNREKDKALEDVHTAENKNKELLDKLKKFAITIKKKNSLYSELENQLAECKKSLETKKEETEQLLLQVEALPSLQEKLQHAEEELNRLHLQRVALEKQKSEDNDLLRDKIKNLNEKLTEASKENAKLNEEINTATNEILMLRKDNLQLKEQVLVLNNKLVDQEVELKNNMNYKTKITSLETEVDQKQNQIEELLGCIENFETQTNGNVAKLQERDLYIESLEADLIKYKKRISRLEETVSVMEERRHSLERKADQLDSQLHEKQKAYSDYINQEDDLISRLAVLMDHDRVVEKQLNEIENENKEMRQANQGLIEANEQFKKIVHDLQEQVNMLLIKAKEGEKAETEALKYQSMLREIESNFTKLNNDHQTLILQKKQDIETLEIEFTTQIDNALKEKNILKKQQEKLVDQLSHVESELNEYMTMNHNLNINIQELTRMNNELLEKSSLNNTEIKPDYTEQYISEINKLNSEVNSKNNELLELKTSIDNLKTANTSAISNMKLNIDDLNSKLQDFSLQVENLNVQLNDERFMNSQLQSALSEKEQEVSRMQQKNKVSFEMNIPKTEGMIISSTIEPLRDEPRAQAELASLESQIITDVADSPPQTSKKETKHVQESYSCVDVPIEPKIVPKTSYLCYKEGEPDPGPVDPFNSDDGWGLGDSEEVIQVNLLSCVSDLNRQILKLKEENAALTAEIDSSNTRILKAVKKIKELKTTNEMISNELKMSKQMTQASFLDTAIEEELRNNIQHLEKQIDDIRLNLSKETREKEALKKQNEVFHSANDKLTEIKEKLDNEVELWKYKFKEVNDKMSTFQWDANTQNSPSQMQPTKSASIEPKKNDNKYKEEIEKLEKENEELQNVVEQLNCQNKNISLKVNNLRTENESLKQDLSQKLLTCQNCEKLCKEMLEIKEKYEVLLEELKVSKNILHETELLKSELEKKYNLLEAELQITDLLKSKNSESEKELNYLKTTEAQLNERVSFLENELHLANAKIVTLGEQDMKNRDNFDIITLSEKCNSLQDSCEILKQDLEVATKQISVLEEEKLLTTNEYLDSKKHVEDLNKKVENLNLENDQLLSSLTELRSSISSAVDQRGFEIAEIWKQHLAQREADFINTEKELKNQLIASETKYEQLLENIQASNQNEANKFVAAEQLASLQSKLQDKEEIVQELQNKYAEAINQLDMLRSEMKDEKILHENSLLSLQEDYEVQIKSQSTKLLDASENNTEKLNNLHTDISNYAAENEELKRQVQYLQNLVEESESRCNEIITQIQIKDSEIYQKTQEYSTTLAHKNEEFEIVRKQLLEFEKKVEELSYEKESELALLRLKMHEQENHAVKIQKQLEQENIDLTEELETKILECTALNKKIADLNRLLEDHSNKSNEMQTALENQELEIVNLKDELENLHEMFKASSSRIEKHVTFASDTKPGSIDEKMEEFKNKELFDLVPRAELDLAMYMLHQRDVRCEELTMELTQLLEERDTLQLRLSDSLRSYEEIKANYKSSGLDLSIGSGQPAVSDLPSFSLEKEQHFVSTHSAQSLRGSSDPDGDKPKLQAKLSELRGVKQNRDVRLRQQSEQRQMDLRLLQQDVANLPPEAIDQLAQAHHTFSRDSQSTSTVLLNWLRGKSTPKVVHM